MSYLSILLHVVACLALFGLGAFLGGWYATHVLLSDINAQLDGILLVRPSPKSTASGLTRQGERDPQEPGAQHPAHRKNREPYGKADAPGEQTGSRSPP